MSTRSRHVGMGMKSIMEKGRLRKKYRIIELQINQLRNTLILEQYEGLSMPGISFLQLRLQIGGHLTPNRRFFKREARSRIRSFFHQPNFEY